MHIYIYIYKYIYTYIHIYIYIYIYHKAAALANVTDPNIVAARITSTLNSSSSSHNFQSALQPTVDRAFLVCFGVAHLNAHARTRTCMGAKNVYV